ncbi:hypothetical protein BDY21DRAFT_367976 [Lineolata rhizophorae]|uniref:Uncharacterized protein n=1 Tax=Lineolata rhizophorae TaxID=578093 RepID=A0A6A6PD37_9PEZI|nr:hypothetical protein BDY21DRAFT_367976 [Lineolata rhizophorae]
MEKLKNILAPGHDHDDEVLYGSGRNKLHKSPPRDSTHEPVDANDANEPTSRDNDRTQHLDDSTTNKSHTNDIDFAAGENNWARKENETPKRSRGALVVPPQSSEDTSVASIKSGIAGHPQARRGQGTGMEVPERDSSKQATNAEPTTPTTGQTRERGDSGTSSEPVTYTARSFPLRGSPLGSTHAQPNPETSPLRQQPEPKDDIHDGRAALAGAAGAATAGSNASEPGSEGFTSKPNPETEPLEEKPVPTDDVQGGRAALANAANPAPLSSGQGYFHEDLPKESTGSPTGDQGSGEAAAAAASGSAVVGAGIATSSAQQDKPDEQVPSQPTENNAQERTTQDAPIKPAEPKRMDSSALSHIPGAFPATPDERPREPDFPEEAAPAGPKPEASAQEPGEIPSRSVGATQGGSDDAADAEGHSGAKAAAAAGGMAAAGAGAGMAMRDSDAHGKRSESLGGGPYSSKAIDPRVDSSGNAAAVNEAPGSQDSATPERAHGHARSDSVQDPKSPQRSSGDEDATAEGAAELSGYDGEDKKLEKERAKQQKKAEKQAKKEEKKQEKEEKKQEKEEKSRKKGSVLGTILHRKKHSTAGEEMTAGAKEESREPTNETREEGKVQTAQPGETAEETPTPATAPSPERNDTTGMTSGYPQTEASPEPQAGPETEENNESSPGRKKHGLLGSLLHRNKDKHAKDAQPEENAAYGQGPESGDMAAADGTTAGEGYEEHSRESGSHDRHRLHKEPRGEYVS